jgi:hypothetical protein
MDAFDRCRFAGGLDWDRVIEEAADEQLPQGTDWYTRDMKRLAKVCAVLQRRTGDQPFYLSYEDAARLLGIAKATAQHAFKLLMRAKLLERITTGSNVERKASTYLYLPMWPGGEFKATVCNRCESPTPPTVCNRSSEFAELGVTPTLKLKESR